MGRTSNDGVPVRFWGNRKRALETTPQTKNSTNATADSTSDSPVTSTTTPKKTHALAALSLSAVLLASGCVFDKSGLAPWEAGAFPDSQVSDSDCSRSLKY